VGTGPESLVDWWCWYRLSESAPAGVITLGEARPYEEGQESLAVMLELVKERCLSQVAGDGKLHPLACYCLI